MSTLLAAALLATVLVKAPPPPPAALSHVRLGVVARGQPFRNHSGGGLNFGRDGYEGSHRLSGQDCRPEGMVMPIAEFDHSDGSCSVTGGYVYRGKALPELNGLYFFSDWCSGILRSLRWIGSGARDVFDWKPVLA